MKRRRPHTKLRSTVASEVPVWAALKGVHSKTVLNRWKQIIFQPGQVYHLHMARTRACCSHIQKTSFSFISYKLFIHGVGKLTYNHTTTRVQHNVPLSPVVFPGCILTSIPPHITKWEAELSDLFSCDSTSGHWQSWLSRLKCVRIYMIWQLLNIQLKGFLKSALLNTVILLFPFLLSCFGSCHWPNLLFVRNPPKTQEPKSNPNNVNLGSQADDM